MLSTQTNREFDNERFNKDRAWTTEEYEKVHEAILALIRTHESWHRADGSIRPSFDGHLYWKLLGALDRRPPHERLDDA